MESCQEALELDCLELQAELPQGVVCTLSLNTRKAQASGRFLGMEFQSRVFSYSKSPWLARRKATQDLYNRMHEYLLGLPENPK